MSLTVRSVALDDDRPLLDLVPDGDAVSWVREGEGLVGWGTAARIEPGAGADRFERAEAEFRALAKEATIVDEVGAFGSGLVALGAFTFDADRSGSVLVVPRVLVGRRDGQSWVTTIDPPDAPPMPSLGRAEAPPRRDRPRYAGSSNPDLHWLEAVAEAIERIDDGEVEKVVLARDHAVWSKEPFDAIDLARRLTERFAECYTFVVDGLVGATPELLLSQAGRTVRSRALAGTTGRSRDEAQDAALGAALLDSAKDRHEHQLAVDSVTEVLEPRCRVLDHDAEPQLLQLDNVQHLATRFVGELATDDSVLDIVAELHPTAAVGGTPRAKALEVLRELERLDRARYAAPVGWTTPAGDGEWGIALRCAQLEGARARLFAGVGIVGGSLPEDELEETRLKLLAMQRVFDE